MGGDQRCRRLGDGPQLCGPVRERQRPQAGAGSAVDGLSGEGKAVGCFSQVVPRSDPFALPVSPSSSFFAAAFFGRPDRCPVAALRAAVFLAGGPDDIRLPPTPLLHLTVPNSSAVGSTVGIGSTSEGSGSAAAGSSTGSPGPTSRGCG